jgi:hypothetical protein
VNEGLFLPNVLESADAVFCANVTGMQTLLGTLPEAVRGFMDGVLRI